MHLFPLGALAALAFAIQLHAKPPMGNWTGAMRQVDVGNEHSYPMKLGFTGPIITTSYPTLDCKGKLKKVGETVKGFVTYQETVTNGPKGRCFDGIITLKFERDKVILGWFSTYHGQPSMAVASLDRSTN